MRARDPLQVCLLAYDRLCTFEFGLMVELFGLPRPEFDSWYRLQVAAIDAGPLRAAGGLTVHAPFTDRVLDRAGTIVIPGWRGADAPVPERLLRKLRRAHEQGARLLSVCSGAFVLAATGLLDGQRATTHWRYADALARRFPAVQVDPDVLFVDAGQLITSAGSAAGLDMGLHLVRRDFGAHHANQVARRLVVPPQRDGGQAQFVQVPALADGETSDSLATLLDSLRRRLRQPHTVASMAREAHMSSRSFARHFKAATGTTPHSWLQHERVRAAQELLERSGLSLEQVAQRCGFADAQLLRLHFRRVVGTTPQAYRKTFRARGR